MPRLLSITPKGRNAARVVLAFEGDAREPVEVVAEAWARARLAKGDEISDAQLAALVRDDAELRCRDTAWRLLGRRPRSRRELETALRQRKFDPAVIDATIARLVELGHLDDGAFARLFVSQRVQSGRSGPRLVRQELAARGVRGEQAAEALAPLESPADQAATARALLGKWNRRSKPEDHDKRRQAAAAFLMRRGFDSDVVWEAVAAVLGNRA
jgi:regulatory protein